VSGFPQSKIESLWEQTGAEPEFREVMRRILFPESNRIAKQCSQPQPTGHTCLAGVARLLAVMGVGRMMSLSPGFYSSMLLN